MRRMEKWSLPSDRGSWGGAAQGTRRLLAAVGLIAGHQAVKLGDRFQDSPGIKKFSDPHADKLFLRSRLNISVLYAEESCQSIKGCKARGSAFLSKIGRLTIDSTAAESDLCRFGASFGTDKSPYSSMHHRHAYTAVYDLLFAGRRFDQLVLGELGILDNMSMHVWRRFFPLATLHGFEYFDEKIAAARAHCLPRTVYRHIDVGSIKSIFHAFNEVGALFDIMIDDSTHLFEHQINFVRVAVDFMKPGGIIVVEDIFRGWDEGRYSQALAEVLPFFTSSTFVETNHSNAYTHGDVEPYYNNDKLLILFRNQVVREVSRPD